MMILIIFSVLLVQSSASFFSKFSGALSTVELSVGKLLSDVGHDLKETYDCTIDAVEEVLYDKDQISKYYDKCKPTTRTERSTIASDKNAPKAINLIFQPVVPVIPTPSIQNAATAKPVATDNKDINKKLSHVEKVVNNEYYRVGNVSSQLEHEFDGLAKNVDAELKKIEEEKEDLHTTLLEIEKLHLKEEQDIEKTKDEVRLAFEEILKKINNKESSQNNKLKDVTEDVSNNSSKTVLQVVEKWKEKEMHQSKHSQINNTEKEDKKKANVPRSFKDVAAIILKEASTTISSVTTQASSTTAFLSSSEAVSQATTIANSLNTQTQVSTTAVAPTISVISTESVTNLTPIVRLTTPITQVPTTLTTIKTKTEPAPPLTSTTTTVKSTTQPVTSTTTTIKSTSVLVPEVPTTLSTIKSTTVPVTEVPTTLTTVKSTSVPVTEVPTTLSTIKSTTVPIPEVPTTLTTAKSTSVSVTEVPTTLSTIKSTTVPVIQVPTTLSTIKSTTVSVIPVSTTTTTTTTTTEPTTKASTTRMLTMKPVVAPVPMTTPTLPSTERATTLSTTLKRLKKRHKKRKLKNKHKRTKAKNKPKTTNTPKPDDLDGLVPKDPSAAVADALKLFNKSIKTKSVLDNFFKHVKVGSSIF